jgi:hypothetical protein
MVFKNIKDISKIQNQPETKILKELRSLFFGVFKVKKKHIILIPFIIWNHLTQQLTILIAKIIINDNFLSLSRNLTTPSFFSIKKELKKRKIKFGNKI